LRDIERKYQAEWEKDKVFEVDPGQPGDEKFFVTFPFPYMNGKLHLGHGFSFSKAEFAVGYNRMKGRKALLPFGFHVTGTPIAACAEKLKKEVAQYGLPPQFPPEEEEVKASPTEKSAADKATSGKFSGKKLKKAANKPQWLIMRDMGLTDDEIGQFRDPDHWLKVFPNKALDDLKTFGSRIDFRRSFITTDRNPYFDSFVKWQFRHLKAADKLSFGKRYTIWSTHDNGPCQDHDRSSGEGVQAQEQTLIKIEVQNPLEQECLKPHADVLKGMKVILPAATLRPETMFGQTNCWILPEGEYSAYQITDTEVFITSERAAINMAWQELGKQLNCTPTPLFTIKGQEMMGLPLSAPNCTFPTVYALPMMTISMEKGTGIVTSVPSDSPDDYMSLMDLKNKPEWRAKLGIKDEWIMPFEVVPIIDIPGFGDRAAETVCKEMKIQSQKDQDNLVKAKAEVYLKGFTEGVMIVDAWKGKMVKDVKPLIRQQMIDNNLALKYAEPESKVVGRSGDICVVALVDQWYLKYGEEEWRDIVKDHIDNKLETYTYGTRRGFEETIGWLNEHACSRTFGLGTSMPFPGPFNYLIDSLSDSTIYMAYYTVSHYLCGGARYNGQLPTEDNAHLNMDGSKPSPSGIKPEDLTDQVWDYIFLGTPALEALDTSIPKDLLQKMRSEFLFWYPMDLRVSGKDLIQNHLTMCLYNHAAIFPKEQWPSSIYCNGHILVDNEKMAKSKGNFLTLEYVVNEYSCDATRITLADAGDGLDDANFVRTVVNAQILKLTKEIDWVKDMLAQAEAGELRTGEYNFFDRVFENAINKIIMAVDKAYAGMMFREAIQTGWFGFQNTRDEYRQAISAGKTFDNNRSFHRDLFFRFVEVQALVMTPITPHFCEHLWKGLLGKPGSVHNAKFPEPTKPVDLELEMSNVYLVDTLHNFRQAIQKSMKKSKTKPTHGVVYVTEEYQDWQKKAVKLVRDVYEQEKEIPKDLSKRVAADPELKKDLKLIMGFVAMLKDQLAKFGEGVFKDTPIVQELKLLEEQKDYVQGQLGLAELKVYGAADTSAPDEGKQKARSEVGKPSSNFWVQEPSAAP